MNWSGIANEDITLIINSASYIFNINKDWIGDSYSNLIYGKYIGISDYNLKGIIFNYSYTINSNDKQTFDCEEEGGTQSVSRNGVIGTISGTTSTFHVADTRKTYSQANDVGYLYRDYYQFNDTDVNNNIILPTYTNTSKKYYFKAKWLYYRATGSAAALRFIYADSDGSNSNFYIIEYEANESLYVRVSDDGGTVYTLNVLSLLYDTEQEIEVEVFINNRDVHVICNEIDYYLTLNNDVRQLSNSYGEIGGHTINYKTNSKIINYAYAYDNDIIKSYTFDKNYNGYTINDEVFYNWGYNRPLPLNSGLSYDTKYEGEVPKPIKFVNGSAFEFNGSDNVINTTKTKLTNWTFACRFNDMNILIQSYIALGSTARNSLSISSSSKLLLYRKSDLSYLVLGSGYDLTTGNHDIIVTQSEIFIDGISKGTYTITEELEITRLLMMNATAFDLRIWDSNIGATECLKYHNNTMTLSPNVLNIPFVQKLGVAMNTVYDVNSNTAYTIAGTVTAAQTVAQDVYFDKQVRGYSEVINRRYLMPSNIYGGQSLEYSGKSVYKSGNNTFVYFGGTTNSQKGISIQYYYNYLKVVESDGTTQQTIFNISLGTYNYNDLIDIYFYWNGQAGGLATLIIDGIEYTNIVTNVWTGVGGSHYMNFSSITTMYNTSLKFDNVNQMINIDYDNIPASNLNIGKDILGNTLTNPPSEKGADENTYLQQYLAPKLIHASACTTWYDRTDPANVTANKVQAKDVPANCNDQEFSNHVDTEVKDILMYSDVKTEDEIIQIIKCYAKANGLPEGQCILTDSNGNILYSDTLMAILTKTC